MRPVFHTLRPQPGIVALAHWPRRGVTMMPECGERPMVTDIKMLRVHANGVDFAVLEQGSGELALCLHGFPDHAWSFRPLMGALAAAGYRAAAPFMRGYGPTGVP